MSDIHIRVYHPGIDREAVVPVKAFPAHARSGWVQVSESPDEGDPDPSPVDESPDPLEGDTEQ